MGTMTRMLTVLVACFAFFVAATPFVQASDPETPPEEAAVSVRGTITRIATGSTGAVSEFDVTPDTGGDPVTIKTPNGYEDSTTLNALKENGTTVTAEYKPSTKNLVSLTW